MALKIIPSFAKGEVTPALFGRVDTAAYQVGMKIALNLVIHSTGGASNRPGTIFVGPAKFHDKDAILVPFKFKTTDQYELEIGDLYMRVIRNNAYVTDTPVAITAATAANPVVITAAGHGMSTGDETFIDVIVGMTELNNRRFKVTVLSGSTFSLQSQVTGVDIDGTGFTAYASGGTTAKIFELALPYVEADLRNLKFAQNDSTITITHPSYAPRDLTRTDHNAWTLDILTYAPEQPFPTGVTLTVVGVNNSIEYYYKVTAINEDDEEESLAGTNNASVTIISATQANPIVIGATGHGFVAGDEVEIDTVVGMTEINGRRFIVQNPNANDFELQGEDGTGYTAYASAGTATATFVKTAVGTTNPNNTIAWTAAAGAKRYAVYRRDNGVFGLIGETELTSYTEFNVDSAGSPVTLTPALTVSPPRSRNPFLFAGDFPTCSTFYEQRQGYGGTLNNPDTVEFSQTGRRLNMSRSEPNQADDAITAKLNSESVNDIRHMVAVRDLIILTGDTEFLMNSGADNGFSASTLRQKPQSSWSADHLAPVKAGTTIIFLDSSKSRIFGLDFAASSDGYQATELSELSSHMFKFATVVDWAYQVSPEPRLHCVLSDGTGVTLTYNQAQEVVAWTRWETDGWFRSAGALQRATSPSEDAIYFINERKIDGNQVRYVERLASRKFQDVRDCFFVDSGVSFDNPIAITGVTLADPVVITATAHGLADGDEVEMSDITWIADVDADGNKTQPDQLNTRRYRLAGTLTNTVQLANTDTPLAISAATQANPVVVTSTAHGRSDGDKISIFDAEGMTELNGVVYKVANKTDDTFELTDTSDVNIDGTAFGAYTVGGIALEMEDSTAFNAYVTGGNMRKTALTIFSLNHLEGKNVMILQDGSVVDDKVVTDGKVTLDRPGARVHVGLPYFADGQLLNFEEQRNTLQGVSKHIPEVTIRVEDTRGLFIGPDSGTMVELKQRDGEKMSDPTALKTGDLPVTIQSEWNSEGDLFFRQRFPLPMTILAIIPRYTPGAY